MGTLDKTSFSEKVEAIKAGGRTRLYDAVVYAMELLDKSGDSDRSKVVVAMTDGKSDCELTALEQTLDERTSSTELFTVAYGNDADIETLGHIAELGDGSAYEADARTIQKLYQLLAAFF